MHLGSGLVEKVDGRLARGDQTRRAVLRRAVDIASVDGLEGLSIGRLATELGISKSGLFAHFGSKEELQLATIQAARERFVKLVVDPVRDAPRGLARIEALVDRWLTYMEQDAFAGGCFFAAVRAEFDSRPDGQVRDAIAADQRDFHALIARQVRLGQEAGEIRADVDPDQLTFEIDALGGATNGRFQLLRDPAVFEQARRAIRARLDAARA
jgi:AcrR family transcriptional regulator